jgi:uncharacterized membrane protein YbhN (UPF0104 family)
MKKGWSVVLFSLVKAAITISLIVVIFTKIDFSALARHLYGSGAAYLLFGTLVLALNILIVALRWWLLLRRLDVETVSLGYAMACTYVSIFVGQATPGPIGADAVRGWLCYRQHVKLRLIVMSLLTDRMLGMLALIVVAGAVWYWLFDAGRETLGQEIAVLAALAVAAGAAALWLLPALTGNLAKRWGKLRALHELLTIFRFTAVSGAGVLGMALSCVVVALTVNAVLLFARGFGVPLTPSVAYLIVPVAVLLSTLPISIGGWGVREASLSYGLALFGVAPADAALLGLALGMGLLFASLPGGIVMLLIGGQVRPVLRNAGSELAE